MTWKEVGREGRRDTETKQINVTHKTDQEKPLTIVPKAHAVIQPRPNAQTTEMCPFPQFFRYEEGRCDNF